MFMCSNKGSLLLKGIPSTKFSVVNVARLIDSIALAPNVEGQEIDAVLVTSDDISSKLLYNKFAEALQSKHPDMVVLYINKKGKSRGEENFVNVNYMLTKPSTDVLKATITEIISSSNRKAVNNDSLVDEEEETVPDFAAGKVTSGEYKPGASEASDEHLEIPPVPKKKSKDVVEPKEDTTKSEKKTLAEDVADIMAEDEDKPSFVVPEITAPSTEDIERVYQHVASPSELAGLMQDISLEVIIKDLIANNSDYTRLEDHISTIAANIAQIQNSDDAVPTEEKLRRIRGLVLDQRVSMSARNTVIMQYVEKIIMTSTSEALNAITKYVDEIKQTLVDARPTANTLGATDIVVLKESRTNALLELDVLLDQLVTMESQVRKLGTDAVSIFVKSSHEFTGDPVKDSNIQREVDPIIPEETLECIKKIYERLNEVPDQFKAMENLIRTTKGLIHKILDVDTRLIEELEKAVERLSLSNISKAALNQELIRRNIRVFIGSANTGRSIIPYLFYRIHSRENSNVLYVNLTGESSITKYGVKATSLGEFILNPIREENAVVAGEIGPATPIEEIVGALQKAGSFYQAIYVAIPDDNEEAVEIITDIALSAYLVYNPGRSNIARQATLLDKLSAKVCLKNIVFNEISNILPKVTEALGIDVSSGVACFKVSHMDAIVSASIEGEDPSYFPTVHTAFSLLRKYV